MGRRGGAGSAQLKVLGGVALAVLLGALLCSGGLGVGTAGAEAPVQGEPELSVVGSILPSTLPRSEPVPATLQVGFELEAPAGQTPELESMSIEIARNIEVRPEGLPSCPRSRLFSTYANPSTVCRRSSVGHGAVISEIALPGQPPTLARGKLRAFYSRAEGEPRILADVTTESPPLTYVIPFTLEKDHGVYGTRLAVRKMRIIHGICRGSRCGQPYRLEGIYSRISALRLTLHRVFVAPGGKKASVVSAACPAPGRGRFEDFSLESVGLAYAGGGQSAALLGRCAVAGQGPGAPARPMG